MVRVVRGLLRPTSTVPRFSWGCVALTLLLRYCRPLYYYFLYCYADVLPCVSGDAPWVFRSVWR